MLRANVFVPMQYCDIGFRIACSGLTLTLGIGGAVAWMASSIAHWRSKPPAEELVRKGPSSRAKRSRKKIPMQAARRYLIASSLLFLWGYVFYFVAKPTIGNVFGMSTAAILLLITMCGGGLALVRSAMLAWEDFGPGSWILRIGSCVLCGLLLGGTYLVGDSLNQMYHDQCGVFPRQVHR